MPYAKNTRVKEKRAETDNGEESIVLKDTIAPAKVARIPDFGEEEEAAIPEEKTEGAATEDAEEEEAALSEDEELDAAVLNPFGDRWEE